MSDGLCEYLSKLLQHDWLGEFPTWHERGHPLSHPHFPGRDGRHTPLMNTAQRIDIDDPEVDMDEAQRLLYRGTPLTGEVTEHLTGKLVSLEVYVDGIQDGPSSE
ncbi:hypothetical protein [Streptomyces sp. NPDC001410]|uniref:hypothetical protein n=1 Tax=Streptomyces sp. NPDC001410 TaxID=3364574 RepID=UPI0036871D9B